MKSTFALLLALAATAFAQDAPSPPAFHSPASLAAPDTEPQGYDAELVNLEIRQAPGVNLNGQAAAAPTQQPAVTVFGMNVAVGDTVTYAMITYTQTFADVPDQLPTAIPGTIGYGTLTKHSKREATPAPGFPLVLELQYVNVDVPIQPVVRLTEVVTIPAGWSNGTSNATSNATISQGTNTTSSYKLTWHILPTASQK